MLGCYEDSSYDLVQLHDICMMHVATAVCVTLHQILQSCKQFGSAIPPAKAINLKKKSHSSEMALWNQHNDHLNGQICTLPLSLFTSYYVMIYHRGASLSEQHTDLLRTKQDLSHTSRYVDESSLEIARYRIRMPTARTATLSVTSSA